MIIATVIGVSLLSVFMIAYFLSVPGYKGPKSDHFDGDKFVNRDAVERPGVMKALTYFITTKLPEWNKWTENKNYPPPPSRVGEGDLQVTFINHSTVLIQMDGLNILTDPIWADRCSPVSWAGPQRHRAPGMAMEDLPPVDVILISHNHYDHLDISSLKQLAKDHQPRIIVGLGNKAFLENDGIANVTEIDWGDQLKLGDAITLYGSPARHFSNRGMFDQDATLWLSFIIKGPAGTVYFAGDTGFGSHFAEAAGQFGPFRLALLPIGAYLPRWFMQDIHISPEEAVKAHQNLKASTSMGIHFGTFQLAMERQNQPVQELNAALDAVEGERPRFWTLDFGESREVPPVGQ